MSARSGCRRSSPSEPAPSYAPRPPAPRAAARRGQTPRRAAWKQVRELIADRERLNARSPRSSESRRHHRLDQTGAGVVAAASRSTVAAALPHRQPAEPVAKPRRPHAARRPRNRPTEPPTGSPTVACRKPTPSRASSGGRRSPQAAPPRRAYAIAASARRAAPATRPRKPNSASTSAAPRAWTRARRWAAVKANIGPLLRGAVSASGRATDTRGSMVHAAVVGPLPNASGGRAICARFADRAGSCRQSQVRRRNACVWKLIAVPQRHSGARHSSRDE